MRYLHYAPKHRRKGFPIGYIPSWPAVYRRYQAELVAATLILAVVGLVMVYVLVLGDSPPEPVASSWSQAPCETECR